MASRLRWLIVLERSRWDLYWDLRKRFAGRAHVLFDRRKGEQRQATLPIERERRQGGERRGELTLPEQRMWQDFGYRLVYKFDGIEIHEHPVEPERRKSRSAGPLPSVRRPGRRRPRPPESGV